MMINHIRNSVHKFSKIAFTKYLLVTNTSITVCLSVTGDYLQQSYEILKKRQTNIDPHRSSRIAFTGLAIGPLCHYWYNVLDFLFPGKAVVTITKKIIFDQIIFSPVNISMFLLIMDVLERNNWKVIKSNIVNDGWTIYKAECIVWPPAQYLNFYFLPTKFRVLFDNTVSLGFDVYYTYIRHRSKKIDETDT